MPKRALRPCKQPGCPSLVESGYCERHKGKEVSNVQSLRSLRSEHSDFYHTNRWKETSKRHRENNPLCAPCYKSGIRTLATIVHHNPELKCLLENKLNPYDEKYLVSICHNCHQKELRRKRG